MVPHSRRQILSVVATGLLAVGGGCTDQPLERTTIRVENRGDRQRRVTVWVVAGDDLAVDETVTVPGGGERALSSTLAAPLWSRRYRVTVQVDRETAGDGERATPAFVTSFTFDEGFDSLRIFVAADGTVDIEPADGV